jgi:formylglycine-generating enzyme required for sulfatase activity
LLSALPATITASLDAALRDCSECPEMVAIPAGRFVMGVRADEEDLESLSAEFRHRSEPRREVRVQPFLAGRFEVTRGQYRIFAEATGRSGEGCFAWTGSGFEVDPARSWRNPGYAQDDAHPVVCVSWEDARAYVEWLGRRTGKRYRLLTEAEWEYAARAGSTAMRYWGDEPGHACEYANGADRTARAAIADASNWSGAECDDRHAYTAPVGSYRANAFGLYDTLGNVGEWTEDCWNRDYRGAPIDGSAALKGECGLRAVRGGAWDDAPAGLRAAYRVGSPTSIRLYSRGFRVAREI